MIIDMIFYNLEDMKKGWFIGDFDVSVFRTKGFEVAIKRYKKGDGEPLHWHEKACEFTVVISGLVSFNGNIFKENAIVIVEPNERVEFKALEESVTCCVKIPSVIGDKYHE